MPIAIRSATPHDEAALIALFRASVREVARRDYSEVQVRAWAPDEIDPARWRARLAEERVFVAEDEAELAGFATLAAGGLIDMLFVHPARLRRGVASALLERIAEIGPPLLRTEASLTARPFFEARGFRVVARQTVLLRGQTFTNFRMERGFSPGGR